MFPSEFGTAVVAAVGATLMSAVVACAPGASTASPSEPAGDHDAFTQCMTDNGVPAPSEGGPGGPPRGPEGPGGPPPDGAAPSNGRTPPGVDQQTWDDATQACAWLAPAPPPRA